MIECWAGSTLQQTGSTFDVVYQTPRSKHYAIKQHWFRSHLKPNTVEVKRISTNEQRADILTKGLGKIQFAKIRKLLCGW